MSEHWPETWEELIDRFCERAITPAAPARGHPPSHDRKVLTDFVETVRKLQPEMTPGKLCHHIYDDHLLYIYGQLGWIDRKGLFRTCGWARHDRYLDFIGVSHTEAEELGWIRVSAHGLQTLYRPSAAQVRTMRAIGKELAHPVSTYPTWRDFSKNARA